MADDVLVFRRRPRHRGRGAGDVDWAAIFAALSVEERRRLSVPPGPQLEPDEDLRAAVTALIEALDATRDRLNLFDRSGALKRRYESFRCALELAGLAQGHRARAQRASAHRRLGELAERRGDLMAALMHYELAVRSRKDVGCQRQLQQMRAYLEQRAARQERTKD